jgi:3-oxoacyl-[acyl-carrier protein] reductase
MKESQDQAGQHSVSGRVALVTGAGRGIGRVVACSLSDSGYRVMAVSRTEAELRQLAAETGAEYLVETVATAAGCERIIGETYRRLGPIDLLLNNAGMLSPCEKPIWDEDVSVWHEVFAINLHGPFELGQRPRWRTN